MCFTCSRMFQSLTLKAKMPQSKKDLRAQKQRANIKAGIGDEKGRIASNQKVKLKLVLNIIFSVMGFQA